MIHHRLSATLIFTAAILASAQKPILPPSFEVLTHRMDVDVDGAPNAYGPPGKPAIDTPDHARSLEPGHHEIVGYLLDEKQRPVVQGPNDPYPGYYVSQTTFMDPANDNDRDPRAYVDARRINYVVRGDYAEKHGVKIGDFATVYSQRTRKAVFAIVGDTGNPTGNEGSLHLLQALGYPFRDGIRDSVTRPEITIRFYPDSNPHHQFFFTQKSLDQAASKLNLSLDFSKPLTPGELKLPTARNR